MLVLAPRGRDFDVISQVLEPRGFGAIRCKDQIDLVDGCERGAAAAIVTDDAFTREPATRLANWLTAQPAWSDFPFIVLTTRRPTYGNATAVGLLGALGNVVLLERPVNAETLGRAAAAALRARYRQHQTRQTLEELTATRATVERLNAQLEDRILARTQELAAANDRLMTEIAERERAQTALVHAQKMEAVGRLTGGIAHDFNNLLQVVSMNLDLLLRKTSDPALAALTGKAKRAVSRGSKLTAQLLSFARSQSLVSRLTDVNGLLSGMQELLAVSAGSHVAVKLELSAGAALARLDANQFEMAILNLVVNAKDAMPERGGTLTIRSRIVDGALPHLVTSRHVVVEVADTGSGIPEHVLSKVFEPFFTTKPVGSGTGLVVSQVYGFARQSGGVAQVESTLGEGTRVQMWFPLEEQFELATAPPDDVETPRPVVPRRVLVVEDDVEVRRVIVDSLVSFGHTVTSAENGIDGLACLRAETPDVMIVDYAMPGMTGAEVIASARLMLPDLPIVLATGYADMVEVGRLLPTKSVLFKPFDVASLLRAVDEACDTAEPIQK